MYTVSHTNIHQEDRSLIEKRGRVAMAINGVVANWDWHDISRVETAVNPMMENFRGQAIDLFSNEGGLAWRWATGNKKYPSVDAIVARLSVVCEKLRRDHGVIVNTVRIATYHPHFSEELSDHVACLLTDKLLSIARPYFWSVFSSPGSRYPGDAWRACDLIGYARQMYIPIDEFSRAPQLNQSGNTITTYGVQKFYGTRSGISWYD